MVAMVREQSVLKRILLKLSKGDTRLWRNNVGAAKMADGSWVRYGVGGNGAADLLGFKSVVITPEMVGQKVAVFLSIEVKSKTGRPRADQLLWRDLVRRFGGIAGVARTPEEAEKIAKGLDNYYNGSLGDMNE